MLQTSGDYPFLFVVASVEFLQLIFPSGAIDFQGPPFVWKESLFVASAENECEGQENLGRHQNSKWEANTEQLVQIM